MLKILLQRFFFFFFLLSSLFIGTFAVANTPSGQVSDNQNNAGNNIYQQDTTIKIREKFPDMGSNEIDVSVQTGSIGILSGYVSSIFKFVAALSVIIAVLVFMGAGFMLMFSGGDSGARENAKEMITKVLLGIAILFLSGLLLNFINPNFYIFG